LSDPLSAGSPERPPDARDAASVALLKVLARNAEIDLDPTRAVQVVRAAAREIPPTKPRAARLRLAQAAAALGIEVHSRQLSLREALKCVAQGTPLTLFTVASSGHARWFALSDATGSRGRLKPLEPGDPTHWLSLQELVQLFSAADEDTVLEWHLAQPAAPLESAVLSSVERDAADAHVHHLPPFRRLIALLRPETADLWIVLFFAVGVGVFTLATPIVAMAVVNSVALGTLLQQLLVLCVALLIALGLAGLLQLLQTVTVEYVQRRVFVRVADDLAHRLPRVDLQAFDRRHGPELVNRFFDVLTVQKASATLLLDGVTIALQVFIGLLLLGFYHVYLLGFDLVLLAALVLLFTLLGRGGVRTAVRESIAKYRVAGWLEEVARHPVAFKTAGGPRLAQEQTDLLTQEYLAARANHFRVLIRQHGFALFLQAAANVALLAIGGALVIRGELTLGELVAAEVVVTLVVATFTKLGKQLEAYYDLLAAVDKLGHLLDLPLERGGGANHHARSNGAAVTVHDVSFGYEGGHRDVLSRLNVRFEPGERVALVGPNGAGKSTLVDVLFGLRQPQSGWVEIDGTDLRSLRLDTLREHVAVVKGVEAIDGTILENVRMGRDEVTLADVRDALRQVGLLDAILEFPDGLDTALWTGGAPLSLGQANRLMVARAIVGQPRLLIVDEALDHMDAEVRERVLPAMLGPNAHWTVLIVTHSDDVARLCDRVIHLARAAAPALAGATS
jgi:putative ABC transport system ATP-binding protein